MAKNRTPVGSRTLALNPKPIEIAKSPPSKNLAHVPCKFFKQGTCQAGSACPFAHTVDANVETAPCKYFQKGNCKFGVKCALAHILPDGRRVNPKTLAQAYQHHNNNNNHNNNGNINHGNHKSENSNGFLQTNSQYPPVSPQNILSPELQSNGLAQYDYFHNQNTSPNVTSPNVPSPYNTSRNSFSNQSSFLYGSTTSHPRTTSMVEQGPSTFTSTSIWSNTAVSSDSNNQASSFYTRSVSHSASFRPTFNTPFSFDHESAIVDDDENDMFEEDFVPSSLSDLLTPQELQRRGSRPSGSRSYAVSQLQTATEYNEIGLIPSSDIAIDPDESETQFKMDDDEFQFSDSNSFAIKNNPGLTL